MNASESQATLTLQDGRKLAYAEVGDRQGKPVLLLTGTGTGRSQAYWFDAAARKAGVRLIVTDRPGYGHSDPKAELSFLNHADDVRELLDYLKLSRVAVAGMSGGGGYAMACGYRMPERIERVVMVCGMVPAPPEVYRKMSGAVRMIFWLTIHMPRLATSLLNRMQGGGLDPDGAAFKRKLKQVPEADRRVLGLSGMPELCYGAPARDALRQGMGIFVREMALYGKPLGFELSQVRVPVRVWHGLQDANVVIDIARYVASSVPGAKLTIEPECAHLFGFGDPDGMMQQMIAP
ncbi:MAG TPA: alpha/beta hydrolase [Nevskiaceae bacterium]|nr:alpha/beta hydrolase [Nevskiaceae bacterium]